MNCLVSIFRRFNEMGRVKQVYILMDNGDLIIPNIDDNQEQTFEFIRDEQFSPYGFDYLSEFIMPTKIQHPVTTLKLEVKLERKEKYVKFTNAADSLNKGVSKYLDDKINQLETLKE